MSKKKKNKYTYNNNRRGKLSVFFFSVIQNGLSFFFYDVYTLPHTRPQETIFDRLRPFVRLFKRRDVKVSSRALIHIYIRVTTTSFSNRPPSIYLITTLSSILSFLPFFFPVSFVDHTRRRGLFFIVTIVFLL